MPQKVVAKIVPALALTITGLFAIESIAKESAVPVIERSPVETQQLLLSASDAVVDFDVAPTRPEVAAIVKSANASQQIIFWTIGKSSDTNMRRLTIPGEYIASALAWHPEGGQLFVLASHGGQFEILKTPSDKWSPVSVVRSKTPLRRMVIGPRPFSPGYRVFYGEKRNDGTFRMRTIVEDGTSPYVVFDTVTSVPENQREEFPPNSFAEKSALPVGFHPAGHKLVWEDDKHCFHHANYGDSNWTNTSKLNAACDICGGTITYSPNGIGLLHWVAGTPGVELIYDGGAKSDRLASDQSFLSTPSSVPDGRGLIGVVKHDAGLAFVYAPVNVPLADVVNAWMFLESPKDRALFTANAGLFRNLGTETQLYQLYDSENYGSCGGATDAIPSRPYLVTTDIFWEVYASAFEGIFTLSERQVAIPAFWDFIRRANVYLKTKQPKATVTKAISTLVDIRNRNMRKGSEAERILTASGDRSSVTQDKFDFANLKPRGHYTIDENLSTYFRASKYLMQIPLNDADIAALRSIPAPIMASASNWIASYLPFIAPARRPSVWDKGKATFPTYMTHTETEPQIFPLSWGLDNEIIDNTVYHKDGHGVKEQRMLPSGLDIAAVLGSKMALTILGENGTFMEYPSLKNQIDDLAKRLSVWNATRDRKKTLYERYIDTLAVQWSEQLVSPENTIQESLWKRKRLQTGLASWASLRHATVLVNERGAAECGEGGFESIVTAPPRGYVEPDPETFDAVARLFESTTQLVQSLRLDNAVKNNDAETRAGVSRRLIESRDDVLRFRDMAKKELANVPLTEQEYEQIRSVGRAAEHNFLIFKSLVRPDGGLANPDPMAKIADVASGNNTLLMAAVGEPLEWDQIVPFFGRKQIVKGAVYSYYEFSSGQILNDEEWRSKVSSQPRPSWIEPFMSDKQLACPAVVR